MLEKADPPKAKVNFGSPTGQPQRSSFHNPSAVILTSSSRWSIPSRVLTLPSSCDRSSWSRLSSSRNVIPNGARSKIFAAKSRRSRPNSMRTHSRSVLFFFRCRIRSAGRYPKMPAQSIVQTICDHYATKRPKGRRCNLSPYKSPGATVTYPKPILFPESPHHAAEPVRLGLLGSAAARRIACRSNGRRHRGDRNGSRRRQANTPRPDAAE